MIKFDGENCILLPNFSRNAISTFQLKDLVNNNFVIETKVEVDWKKLNPEKQRMYGIVSLNGQDMGIFCNIYGDVKIVTAEVWTQKDVGVQNEIKLEVVDDILDIKFIYNHNKDLELVVNGKSEKINLDNVIDYQTSFLWIGCCNNNLGTPNHLTGNFLGNMNYLKISAGEKVFLESDFKRVTDYKVYDKSGNGNHLLKKFLNEEGQITIF